MEDNNVEILKSIFLNYGILQVIIFGISFLIWKIWIKLNKRIWTIITLVILSFYLFHSIKLIFEILNVKDLRIGGYTFAFEMMNLAYGAIFLSSIVILGIFSKVLKSKKTSHNTV